MIDSRGSSTVMEKNVLVYLKSQQLLAGNLDLKVESERNAGVLWVRKGRVVGASWGNLSGNGALLNLCLIRDGKIESSRSEETAEHNVSLSLLQVERILGKLPNSEKSGADFDERKKLDQVIRLFYQFRRKEAGAGLVEILRFNRFYYPAWLWYSRLMTREDYIKKALGEARKWGNSDPRIKGEIEKVEPQLTGSGKGVKRCFFCWSPVDVKEEKCNFCKGLLRIPRKRSDEGVKTDLLEKSLLHYEEELQKNPTNTRIAYCLCLGFFSLGQNVKARDYIRTALKISPREPLFIKTAALLAVAKDRRKKIQQQKIVVQTAAGLKRPESRLVATEKKGKQKTVLVVEDSQTSRKVISMLLARKGYNILEATKGIEAFSQTEKVVPDLVLLDVMLPDMTGYEVLAQFKKDSRFENIPVVMLTGKNSPTDRLRGMKGGADEYLTKPFDPARLLEVIVKYCEVSVQPEAVAVAEKPPTVVLRTPPEKKPSPSFPTPVVHVPVAKEKGKNILVVEDSPTSRKVISMILTRKGYSVTEAVVGAEALQIVEEKVVDLVLLDVMLPDMSGFDILISLKKDQKLKKIPVVMLTGKKGAADREKGIRAGAVEYLTKPFDPGKLVSVIDEYA